MLRGFIRNQLARFGNRYDYDVGYLAEATEADPVAVLKLSLAQAATRHRRGVPAEPYYAAKIRTVAAEDCGPCTQLAVNMALEAGVDPDHVSAVVTADYERLPEDTALAARFADRVAARAGAFEEREAIRARWGELGLVSLSLAIATTRLYPTLKAALGHGLACTRVSVASRSVAVQGAEPGVPESAPAGARA